MEFIVTGLTAPVALAALALVGYWIGRQQRVLGQSQIDQQQRAEADAVIDQVTRISHQLRQSMAMHHASVNRCREQVRQMCEHAKDPNATELHMHAHEILAPTDRLVRDIAHAYDELRQHTSELTELRAQ